MSDRFRSDPFASPRDEPGDDRPRDAARPDAPLPWWIKRRLLRPEEEVVSVRGPRFSPSWERYVTHVGLFLAALAAAAVLVGVGLIADAWVDEAALLSMLLGALLVFLTICVLGIANGHFTRLVVTDQRVVILQGYEIRRTWGLDDLPPSLVRRRRRDDGETERSIDLDALKNAFGGSSGHFAEAKAIWAFGKELDRQRRHDRR